MMQLSKRLQAVANMVTNTECMADVGTDHGYIPIYLVEQGICKNAIAMDINRGPLQRAEEHIKEHQLGAYIETRLSDGLAALTANEAETIVIAGMGGATMCGILEAGKTVIGPSTTLVLQPQSEVEEFRRYLQEQGFMVLAEDMVCEDGKYYPMMKVCLQEIKKDIFDAASGLKGCGSPPCSKIELLYGPLLLEQKHPVLQSFLVWQLGQKEKILENLAKNATAGNKEERMECVGQEIACIKQALNLYKKE